MSGEEETRSDGEGVSRREVLGAAVALPLIGGERSFDTGLRQAQPLLRMSGKGEPGEEDWDAALASYRAAEGAVEEAGQCCSAAPRGEIEAAEERFGDRLEEMYERLRALLVVPAPDLGALLVKVELAFEHEIGTLSGTGACVAAIRGDVRRFAGGGAPWPSRE